jgi:hypothetical protein
MSAAGRRAYASPKDCNLVVGHSGCAVAPSHAPLSRTASESLVYQKPSLSPTKRCRAPARWGPVHRCSFRSLSRLRQLKSMDTQCVEHEHPSRHAKLSSLRGVRRVGEMAWRMGHAIRDAAHAIMPRMRLVCAGSIAPQEQRATARVCKRVVTTMNRGGNPVIKRVVMTRQIYYQQYRCDSTRTTAQPAHEHDLSPPPRADSRRSRSQQGRVSRGALPVAGQRQRPAAPRRRRTPALTRSRSALPGCH